MFVQNNNMESILLTKLMQKQKCRKRFILITYNYFIKFLNYKC